MCFCMIESTRSIDSVQYFLLHISGLGARVHPYTYGLQLQKNVSNTSKKDAFQ